MADPAMDGERTELTVDQLAHVADVPVRTIREYQALGLLPAPERRGRVGIYRRTHVERLQLIGRLQQRGYSLAGIGDLLASWREGADLGEVLGLDPDQLVHLDEPGTPVTVEQLSRLVPDLVPTRIIDLLDVGVIESCGPDRFCVPSPSLLQLTIDLLAAGYQPKDVIGMLRTIRDATGAIASAVVGLLSDRPAGLDDDRLAAVATRGRGLLAHGTGRITIHAIGRLLGVGDHADTAIALRRLAGES